MIKVLVFTPGGVGGAERMSVLVGKLLPQDEFVVKYVVLGKLHDIYNLIPKGYAVDCIPVKNRYEFSTLRIWWTIKREKPDYVFCSQVAYNPRVIIAARMAGVKVIIRSSGMVRDYSGARLRIVKKTYPLANKLIAQQEDMREEMINLLDIDPNKVVSIHNPLDTMDIDRLSKAPSPYQSVGDVCFIQSASVSYRKAQDVSINAFAIVKKKIPSSHLFLVGHYDEKSEYYRSLKVLVKNLHIDDCVHFVGYDENPFRWIKNADCFVFPSRAEGLPNALIEASYLKIPCVAARCLRIVDDIIKDGQNGFVVDVNDIEGMSQGMIKAVKLNDCRMVYKPGCADDFRRVFINY